MSYIIGHVICERCQKEIDYYWVLADAIFEEIPKIQCARKMKTEIGYDVFCKCDNCRNVVCVKFDFNGKISTY